MGLYETTSGHGNNNLLCPPPPEGSRNGSTGCPRPGDTRSFATAAIEQRAPIVLTSTTYLIQLQRHIQTITTDSFEFRNTRSETRIVTKEMADFSAIKKYLEKTNLAFFTYFPKSEKSVKAVIRHLPLNNLLKTFLTDW
jgi:hypothetical protein